MHKPTILILCSGNSSRSHIAQGLLAHMTGGKLRVLSAGLKPCGYVHPMAVQVMQEIGIDISDHRSRDVREYLEEPIDVLITVCDQALENVPEFPKHVRRYHWGFVDPGLVEGGEDERLEAFRKLRDQMRVLIAAYVYAHKADDSYGQAPDFMVSPHYH